MIIGFLPRLSATTNAHVVAAEHFAQLDDMEMLQMFWSGKLLTIYRLLSVSLHQ